MKTHRICNVCGKPVVKETKVKEYPFYCPDCCENRYRIETARKSGGINEKSVRKNRYGNERNRRRV